MTSPALDSNGAFALNGPIVSDVFGKLDRPADSEFVQTLAEHLRKNVKPIAAEKSPSLVWNECEMSEGLDYALVCMRPGIVFVK
jgi:hypothetical protein